MVRQKGISLPFKVRAASRLLATTLVIAVGLLFLPGQPQTAYTQEKGSEDKTGTMAPYANNNGIPLPSGYMGPRYVLNHAYPQTAVPPPANPPWRQALGGKPIGPGNSVAYVNAVKNYIAPDMKTLVNDYEKWNPAAAHWYDQPWIGPANTVTGWPGREAIQGSYPGPGFGKQYYGVAIQDYVIVYYNPTAAYTLYKVWQQNTNPYKPNVANADFDEGSIVVKLAVTTAQGDDPSKPNYWPVLKGTAKSKVFQPPFTNPSAPSVITEVAALQFDIIVKDTKTTMETGSKTGWVFSTLVYDKDAPGETPWDRMVPLGAMWGNDPKVAADDPTTNVGMKPNQKLDQTVVNSAAPPYAKITLGYGGRLSGPNDAAANIAPPPSATESGQSFNFFRMSSCMSCHGTAAAPPSATLVPIDSNGKWLDPGSKQWLEYFQSRPGNVPQAPGKNALDYDMVMSQALSNLQAASGAKADVERAKTRLHFLRLRGNLDKDK
jgi:hypothetical protein